MGDQRYWADRLHDLGVAPAPIGIRELTGARLGEAALAAAADPRLRGAAESLAARMTEEDGVGVAVGLLERAAGRERG